MTIRLIKKAAILSTLLLAPLARGELVIQQFSDNPCGWRNWHNYATVSVANAYNGYAENKPKEPVSDIVEFIPFKSFLQGSECHRLRLPVKFQNLRMDRLKQWMRPRGGAESVARSS
ncbi:MAG: hypothetical protein WC076_12910 [Terrimicrobiaceae bacterium]|nr:hypothetical protein [Terrimicrobiaceae bacterium]